MVYEVIIRRTQVHKGCLRNLQIRQYSTHCTVYIKTNKKVSIINKSRSPQLNKRVGSFQVEARPDFMRDFTIWFVLIKVLKKGFH